MNNRLECPHCGALNVLPDDAWIDLMEHPEYVCTHCEKTVHYQSETNGVNESEETVWESPGIKFWGFFIALLALMFILNRLFNVLTIKEDLGQILFCIAFSAFVSYLLAFRNTWQIFKYLLIWAAIFLISIVAYSYRSHIVDIKNHVMAELIPERGAQKTSNSMRFNISSDGHFYIRATVNNTPIRFLVDTGASQIVLTPKDAGRLGFSPDNLVFNQVFQTANGTVRGSSIKLNVFSIGDYNLMNLPASVNEVSMGSSLIGMTFFNRLESYEFKGDVLTLNWK